MFTRNQIEEIRKKLQLEGRKDTSFPLAGPLKGNETVAIVQQGQNKQLGLKTLIEKVGIYTVSDFINLSKSSKDSYTLEEVIKLVEPVNRKAGQVITFMDSSTGDWAIYQFKGDTASEWFNLELWDNILAKADNHFKGWFLNDCLLYTHYPRPLVGDFAFVGDTLEDSMVYACIQYGEWYPTNQTALEYANKYEAVLSKDFGEFSTQLDESYADRATKDALGNTIHDTYITREGLKNTILSEVSSALNTANLPEGSVTMESLSESVKQFIGSLGNIVNAADDEDLTAKNNLLKFKDKEYSESEFSGYGRVHLRKNMIEGINVLEQYQVNKENTIYKIQYTYCLNSSTINIPKNCILDFTAGGSFNNGTLNCDNVLIIVPRKEDLTVTLTGNYTVFALDSSIPNVVDNLESTSTTDALSANQGRVLYQLFLSLNNP